MAYIFAGSPGELAGQRFAYDQSNIRLAQSDQALRQKAVDEYVQQEIANQRQADEDLRNNNLLRQNFLSNEAGRSDADRRDIFNFGVNRADRAYDLGESKRRFDVSADLTRAETNARNQQYRFGVDEKKQAQDYADLTTAIQQGEISDPNDIPRLFPGLSPEFHARARTYLETANRQQNEEWQGINNIAQAVTQMVNPEPVKPPKTWGGLYQPATPVKPTLTEEAAMTALGEKAKVNKMLLNAMPQLRWNEEAQRFEPTMRKPFGFGKSNAPSPGLGGGPSPVTAPVAPAPAPAPVPAANPFAVQPGPMQFTPPPPMVGQANGVFTATGPARPTMRLSPVTPPQPARPRTVQEFNLLPMGAFFVNPKDGKVSRKTRNIEETNGG